MEQRGDLHFYSSNYITPHRTSWRTNKSITHSDKLVEPSQKSNTFSHRNGFVSRSTLANIFTSEEEMKDLINCWL